MISVTKIICELVFKISSVKTPLIVPCVPTGIKAGVSIEPLDFFT